MNTMLPDSAATQHSQSLWLAVVAGFNFNLPQIRIAQLESNYDPDPGHVRRESREGRARRVKGRQKD